MHDDRFAHLLGNLLRIGVLASAVVVLIGGAIYLMRHWEDRTAYGDFDAEHLTHLHTPHGIVKSALGAGDNTRGRGVTSGEEERGGARHSKPPCTPPRIRSATPGSLQVPGWLRSALGTHKCPRPGVPRALDAGRTTI